MHSDRYLSVKPSQLKQMLKEYIKRGKSVLVVGEPGGGKTTILGQVAEEIDHDLVVSHPAIQSPTDYRGMPIYEQEEKRAKFLPYEALEQLVTTTTPTIFFLDDAGQATPSVQAAFQNLLSSRQVGDHKISDKVVFIIATNDRGQGAHVTGMLSTIKSRCATILKLEPDPTDWLDWAVREGIRPEVTGFIKNRPEMLSKFEVSNEMVNFPCPRTVANLSDNLKMNFTPELRFIANAGSVGLGFANEFEGWLRLYESMVSPDYILSNPLEAEIPSHDPSAVIAVTSALAYLANKENLSAIMLYGDRLEPEFRINMIEYNIMARYPKLKETKAYIEWAVKNQKHMTAQ